MLKYFSTAMIGKKLVASFFVDLVIRGKIGLCCNVRPMKQLGRAAWITFRTAFQNESTSIAACRFRRGLSNVGSTIDCARGVALRCRFVATVASSRLNYLSQLRSRLIAWGGAKIQLKIFCKASVHANVAIKLTKKFNNQQSKGNYLYGNAHG